MDKVTKQLTPKERILKTVDHLFREQGYLSTGINQIIAEAQVAKASFYQNFSSKEALILEYLEAQHSFLSEQLQQLDQQFPDPKAKILGLFDFLADFVQQAGFRGCIFLNMSAEFSEADSEPRKLIAQCKTDLKDYVEQLVRHALPEYIPDEIAQTKATAIYLLLEASLVESLVHHSTWPFQASKAAVIQLLS